MWSSLTENPESIRAIYGDEIPSLRDIYLHELGIINGVDLTCKLRFDLKSLPSKLPSKWIQKGVNTVQIHLRLVGADIIFFEYSGSRLLGNIEFIAEGDIKRVEFAIFDRKVFALKSK